MPGCDGAGLQGAPLLPGPPRTLLEVAGANRAGERIRQPLAETARQLRLQLLSVRLRHLVLATQVFEGLLKALEQGLGLLEGVLDEAAAAESAEVREVSFADSLALTPGLNQEHSAALPNDEALAAATAPASVAADRARSTPFQVDAHGAASIGLFYTSTRRWVNTSSLIAATSGLGVGDCQRIPGGAYVQDAQAQAR